MTSTPFSSLLDLVEAIVDSAAAELHEPGDRGAVVDRHGEVWQRFGPLWYSPTRPLAMLGIPGREWSDLVGGRGPVRMLLPGDPPFGHRGVSSAVGWTIRDDDGEVGAALRAAFADIGGQPEPEPEPEPREPADADRALVLAAIDNLRAHAAGCDECASLAEVVAKFTDNPGNVDKLAGHLADCSRCRPAVTALATADVDGAHDAAEWLRRLTRMRDALLSGEALTPSNPDVAAFLADGGHTAEASP